MRVSCAERRWLPGLMENHKQRLLHQQLRLMDNLPRLLLQLRRQRQHGEEMRVCVRRNCLADTFYTCDA